MELKQYEVKNATQNACKLCAPLGASLAFRGIEGALPFLHGSQGCATYMRRYLIGHFREPVDVACSNFSESSAIFGGANNLEAGLDNVIRQYQPQLVGIATTCLSETIGDDVQLLMHEYRAARKNESMPAFVHVSTPSYKATHAEGFHATIKSVAESLVVESSSSIEGVSLNLLPGMVSPADLRYLHEILRDFGIDAVVLPDFSDTLDGPTWDSYQRIPAGGTKLEDIQRMGDASVTVQFGSTFAPGVSAGDVLEQRHHVKCETLPIPIGIEATDELFGILENLTDSPRPHWHATERGRLVDAYIDSHKYLFGRRVAIYGEEDLVVALAAFVSEVGMQPVVCASGGESGRMKNAIQDRCSSNADDIQILNGVDFVEMEHEVEQANVDLLIGNSKGYPLARKLNLPLVRVGFPIHDRFGAARILHVGYRGTQQLLDRIVNTLLDQRQGQSDVGYAYL